MIVTWQSNTTHHNSQVLNRFFSSLKNVSQNRTGVARGILWAMATQYLVTDDLWEALEPLLPEEQLQRHRLRRHVVGRQFAVRRSARHAPVMPHP